jgi:predicted SnoaL-like aldol condensation-catalyzing enzyme
MEAEMKRSACAIACIALVALGAGPACAHELTGHNASERTVLRFLDTAFNKRQPEQAFAANVGATYRQHNPGVADGAAAAITAFYGFLPKVPGFHYDFKRVISSGNYVVVHSHVTVGPTDRGNAVVDIFRLSHGKVVEHWDVNQPVPETAANANTMF